MRARHERVLAERDAVAAVAAEVGHDGAVVVDGVARATTGATGGGAGDLVLLARHGFFVCET